MLRFKTASIAAFAALGLALAPGDDVRTPADQAYGTFARAPTDRESLRRTLASLDEAGDMEEQESFLKRALETAPSETLLLDSLAYSIYLPQKRSKDAIEVFARLSARLEDRNATVATILGDAYSQLGDDDAALRYARMAATNDAHPKYELHLASFLVDVGQTDDAQDALRRARSKLAAERHALGEAQVVELDLAIDRETAKALLEAGDVAGASQATAALDAKLAALRAAGPAEGGAQAQATRGQLYDRVESETKQLKARLAH